MAEENSRNFCSYLVQYENVHEFLHREADERLVIRSTNATYGEQMFYIRTEYDIDGIVLELDELSSTAFDVSYLNLLPKGRNSLLPLYNVLKKHLKLSNFNKRSLSIVKMCHGIQLFSAGGWQVSAVLLPHERLERSTEKPNITVYKNKVFDFFEAVKSKFTELLLGLPTADSCLDTIKKNKLYDVSSWRVLRKDQRIILQVLDSAFYDSPIPSDHRLVFLAYRFGERETSEINLASSFDTRHISNMSVHAAVSFLSEDDNCHLFWSRVGLQDVIGHRGMLKPALSMHECCNFQSNLDGAQIDIGEHLRNVCKYPCHINFIQCYADSPHMHCDSIHPVSGIIATSGLLHPDSYAFLKRNCDEYLSVMLENKTKLIGIVGSRLEVVVRLPEIRNTLTGKDLLSEHQIERLIQNFPMFVPFKKEVTISNHPVSVISLLQDVGTHLHDKLKELVLSYECMGALVPTWEAYQIELANEIFWYGRPNSWSDNNIAQNLGPGNGRENRSLTFFSGFLQLSNPTSCIATEKSPPPIKNWVRNEVQEARIKRLFSFSDFLLTNDTVLGTRLLLILFEDLKVIRSELNFARSLLADMRAVEPHQSYTVMGALTAEQLAVDLSQNHIFKYPYVFGRALGMIQKKNRDPKSVIRHGIQNLRLLYFPCYRVKPKFDWKGSVVSKVIHESTNIECDASRYTNLIISELESNSLVFRSKLQNIGMPVFPWVPEICNRLSGLQLNLTDIVSTLTFTTCICLIQSNWFVNFSALLDYEKRLKISQSELQRLKIMSVFVLRGILGNKLYRIHEDIQCQFIAEDKCNNISDVGENDGNDVPVEIVRNIEEATQDETIQRHDCSHLPARCKRAWSREEIQIVLGVMEQSKQSLTYRQMYKTYLEKCQIEKIPDRSFIAFRTMCIRLKKKS